MWQKMFICPFLIFFIRVKFIFSINYIVYALLFYDMLLFDNIRLKFDPLTNNPSHFLSQISLLQK
jgi:hypothetical protein